jgi:HK97 family phage major capsid protein
LLERRAAAVAEMRALADGAERETRDLNATEDARFGTLKAEIADLDKKIGRAQTLAEAERAAPAVLTGRVGDGAFEERARDFSIVKAIRASLPADLGGGGVDAGFEREMSAEVSRRSGRAFQGIAIPDAAFDVERRTLLAGSSAADLIPNLHRADLFVNRLRDKLICARLGATMIDGLVGTVDVPRQTGSATVQWLGEDEAVTPSDPSFDDLTFSPHTVAALTSWSRRTMISASPSIENLIRADLAAVVASAIDAVALTGDGTSNRPTGITHSGAYEVPAGTALTWAEVLAFVAAVEGSNALDGSLGWALNTHVKTLLRSALVAAGTDSRMIMTDPNSLAGYPAISTNALPGSAPSESPAEAGTVVFGDWSSLMIGSYSGLDLLINPYLDGYYQRGRIAMRVMRDVDVKVRHPESFAFGNDLTT